MKNYALTFALLAALLPAANAQPDTALSQLLDASSPSLQTPAAPLPDRSAAWDASAPFSYHQKPAGIVSRGRSAVKVRNVRWGALPADGKSHRWETASVFPELLEKAYYGLRTAGTGHSFLVFVFKDGGFSNSSGETSRALTIGAEPYTRAPEGYVRSNDLLNRYPLVWNLTTLDNYADFNVNSYGSDVQLSPVNLPREETLRLLNAALEKVEAAAAAPQTHVLYANNCTTSAVALLNSALPENLRIPLKRLLLTNPDAAFPRKAVARYTELGVLSAGTLLFNSSNYAAAEKLAAE
jgi:hypothetical protein